MRKWIANLLDRNEEEAASLKHECDFSEKRQFRVGETLTGGTIGFHLMHCTNPSCEKVDLSPENIPGELSRNFMEALVCELKGMGYKLGGNFKQGVLQMEKSLGSFQQRYAMAAMHGADAANLKSPRLCFITGQDDEHWIGYWADDFNRTAWSFPKTNVRELNLFEVVSLNNLTLQVSKR